MKSHLLFLGSLSLLFQASARERHPFYDALTPHDFGQQSAATELHVAPASDIRLTHKTKELPTPAPLRLTAWQGERCSAQLAIRANGAARQLSVSCAGLKCGEQSIPVTATMLRYTAAHGVPTADIIGRESTCDNPAGVIRGAWLQIDIPRNTRPGTYRGSIRITAAGCSPVQQEVELQVQAAALPPSAEWSMHLDLWQHPQAIARWHDVAPWSEEHFTLMRPIMKRLADAGQKCITCTLLDEAWNGQTYDWFPSMVQWIRGKDGVMRYDYSALDAWISFMHDDIGIREQISCYTMIPWHLSIRYLDETTGEYTSVKATPGTAEYAALWAPFLRDFRRHLQEKGWLHKTCIAIDERPDAYVRAAMQLVQENAPELRIASAVDKPSELTREVYNISPVLTHAGSALGDLLRERKAAGKITTFYVCLHPLKPNTFTYSTPAESEWLGYFAAANHLDGFLRWAYNSWNRNPFETTDFVKWPSGDCFLVYPGNLSSVRFERLRDGIEAYEKIRLLRSRAEASPQAAQIVAEMNQRLAAIFTVERSQGDTHTEDIRQARQIITDTLNALSALPMLLL